MSLAGDGPPVRAKRLPREVRERQILDAAVTVFSQHGYHDASMDEISEVAGISKPMIYAYLGAKEDLFAACIHREATLLLEAIVGGIEAGPAAGRAAVARAALVLRLRRRAPGELAGAAPPVDRPGRAVHRGTDGHARSARSAWWRPC